MRSFDYILVGQGIAGTLLAHFLLKKGKSVIVVDQLNPSCSSRVAAGIFNPITGRRFVKTWMADQIFPFAEITYRELEEEFSQPFYFPKNIVRILSSEVEKQEWEKKSRKAEYTTYLSSSVWKNEHQSIVEVLKGGFIDLEKFIRLMNEKFKKMNLLVESRFSYEELEIFPEKVRWKNIFAGKIIFCEGIKAMQNPWFGHLPFTHAKGEVLTIQSENLKQDYILSKGIFVVPLGNDLYKVGSTYDWDDLGEYPTEKGKTELVEKLNKTITADYTILNHQAGIRPTVKYRRPLIGMHPEFSQLGIFNGLGTKGVSLGPYFASHFVNHLEDGLALDYEVDIKRYST